MLLTASIYPALVFGIGFSLNTIAIFQRSLAAVPFGTMVVRTPSMSTSPFLQCWPVTLSSIPFCVEKMSCLPQLILARNVQILPHSNFTDVPQCLFNLDVKCTAGMRPRPSSQSADWKTKVPLTVRHCKPVAGNLLNMAAAGCG